MLPFNPSFRNLLRRFIPQLIDEDVDDYENAVSLWHQFRQEKNILDPRDPNNGVIDDLVARAAGRTNEVLGPVRNEFNNLQRLYTARRRVGLSGGKFLQIPSSPGRFKKFVIDLLKLRWLHLKNFWFFVPRKLKYTWKNSTKGKVAMSGAMAGLLSVSLYNVEILPIENVQIASKIQNVFVYIFADKPNRLEELKSKTIAVSDTIISGPTEIVITPTETRITTSMQPKTAPSDSTKDITIK